MMAALTQLEDIASGRSRRERFLQRSDLSHNRLQVLDRNLFSKLPNLNELKLNHNKLEAIPDLGPCASNITTLIL
ncbi:hypothetical protein ATANTOWER_017013, partial [Ataeniobius toweri]|nr:hypothetical protein [Ataeniobius toweri]